MHDNTHENVIAAITAWTNNTTNTADALKRLHSGLVTALMWAAQDGVPHHTPWLTEAAHAVVVIENVLTETGHVPPSRPTCNTPHIADYGDVSVKAQPMPPRRLTWAADHVGLAA